jgi:hypothetical protein
VALAAGENGVKICNPEGIAAGVRRPSITGPSPTVSTDSPAGGCLISEERLGGFDELDTIFVVNVVLASLEGGKILTAAELV